MHDVLCHGGPPGRDLGDEGVGEELPRGLDDPLPVSRGGEGDPDPIDQAEGVGHVLERGDVEDDPRPLTEPAERRRHREADDGHPPHPAPGEEQDLVVDDLAQTAGEILVEDDLVERRAGPPGRELEHADGDEPFGVDPDGDLADPFLPHPQERGPVEERHDRPDAGDPRQRRHVAGVETPPRPGEDVDRRDPLDRRRQRLVSGAGGIGRHPRGDDSPHGHSDTEDRRQRPAGPARPLPDEQPAQLEHAETHRRFLPVRLPPAFPRSAGAWRATVGRPELSGWTVSEMIRPSAMRMQRPASAAMPGSWVTSTTVWA